MSEPYIVFGDFGSVALKFVDEKEYIKNNIKGFTFSPSAWKELKFELLKQGVNVDKQIVRILGIEIHLVELQKEQCLGWYDHKQMLLYIKIAEVRYATFKQTLTGYTNNN